MASKEKVDIKRSDQFQEVDEELSRAMADLDSTIERVNAILHPESDEDDLLPEHTPNAAADEASGSDGRVVAADVPEGDSRSDTGGKVTGQP